MQRCFSLVLSLFMLFYRYVELERIICFCSSFWLILLRFVFSANNEYLRYLAYVCSCTGTCTVCMLYRIRAVRCGDGQHCGVSGLYSSHQVRDHWVPAAAIRLVQGRRRRGQRCRRHHLTVTVQHKDHAVGFQVRIANVLNTKLEEHSQGCLSAAR